MGLSDEFCVPPQKGDSPLSGDEVASLRAEVPEWSLKENSIERDFKFKDFKEAIAFTNAVAGVADSQDHHPDILVSYNRVRLTLTTHKTGGLTRNDFILASRIDRLKV